MNYLAKYQTFKSKQELNEAVNGHIKRHTYELNDTTRAVLVKLAQYSVKYPGAAHLKIATIAELVGKSAITVRRALTKLVELGIIEKVTFMREVSGGNGANIYRILPSDDSPQMIGREVAEKPDTSSDQAVENENEPINSLKQNNIINNTYYKPLYVRFKDVVSLLNVDNVQTLLSRLYGVYKAHSKYLLIGQAYDEATVENIGLQALKVAIQATKRKSIRNLAGYYNGVLDRMLDRLYYDAIETF